MTASTANDCPFCRVPEERIIECNPHAFALADGFPVSPGHTLIVARRHVADFFELADAEMIAVIALLRSARDRLLAALRPDGFNIGANAGAAAGQTVFHVHVHLIPRFAGDVPYPEGGIRNLIPGKGRYRT
jgi:diadenosine tetraphosphate (Ap4A) HIT family hydrolase